MRAIFVRKTQKGGTKSAALRSGSRLIMSASREEKLKRTPVISKSRSG